LSDWQVAGVGGSAGADAACSSRMQQPALKALAERMDTPLAVHSVVAVAGEQVSCPLGDEAAILSLENSVYYGVDAVGARVWKLLQQPRSVGQLRDTLIEEYEVDRVRCEHDLLAFLEHMLREGLIEVRNAPVR
jgi:Coenzyme PQQ synthesis protein D (PqqD)